MDSFSIVICRSICPQCHARMYDSRYFPLSFTGSLARRLFPNSPPKPVPVGKEPSRKEVYLSKAKQFCKGPGLKYSFMRDGEQRFGFASGGSESQVRAAVLKAHPDACFIPSE
jgi:hypothetical protein